MRFENDRFVTDDDLSGYCFEVVWLASLNKTPKEIEERLGPEPYSIHEKFHTHLMTGYKFYFDRHEWDMNLTSKRIIQMNRVRGRLNKLIAGIENDE